MDTLMLINNHLWNIAFNCVASVEAIMCSTVTPGARSIGFPFG
jgi:hypothetical protein